MSHQIDHLRREPAPGVFRLVLPLPFPGLESVNCYLLADPDGATLVDCGLKDPALEDGGWPHLVEALAAIDLTPQDVKRVVITHVHIDHYGMAARLKEESDCEVVFHEGGNEDLEVLRDPASITQTLWTTFASHGVAKEDLDELTSYEDWRGYVHEIIGADVWLRGDEILAAGARNWRIVHTPGHARGHVCLYDEVNGLMITGDHLLPAITPHIDFRRGEGDPLGDFLTSLEKLEALAPKVVLPGHGHPFEDGAERARVTARHHDRRLGAILQVIRRQASTASQITEEIFSGELLNFQRRLALGEALAHLHYLRVRGEIERFQDEDGTFWYVKAKRRPQVEVEE